MNPNYQANLGANNATAPTRSVNDPGQTRSRNYNKFPCSYSHFNTLRYGEISPFFVFEGVEGDKVPFSSKHEMRTYTLSAPLMSDIRMNKDYFLVPLQAILPHAWELIYTNPTQGDDVPDSANTIFQRETIYQTFKSVCEYVKTHLTALANNEYKEENLSSLLRISVMLDVMFSDGSLLSTLGCKYGNLLSASYNGSKLSLDKWLQMVYSKFINDTIVVQFADDSKKYVINPALRTDNSFVVLSRHGLIERMRSNIAFYVSALTITSDDTAPKVPELVVYSPHVNGMPLKFNYSRCCAYQLCCAHFYTNDKIDFIYSAQLYRDAIFSLTHSYQAINPDDPWNLNGFVNNVDGFEYNGRMIQFDSLSGYYIEPIFKNFGYALTFASAPDNLTGLTNSLSYNALIDLFGYQHSLRYGDYFTGARPFPLAVGDVSAPVVDSKVSAIDMTRNIQMQRFLNAVNRIGRTFSEYVTKVMGGAPVPDAHDPKFLTHSVSSVGGFEVENTAENQGNVTTLLRSNNDNYEFSVEVDQPCIILGLVSFDIPRVYSKVTSKFLMKENRFDMFNPYMQYVGDQSIARTELGVRYGTYEDVDAAFAYTGRHMEYKQGVNVASGGFVENLPAWAFITDNGSSGSEEIPHEHIDPEFIRSRSSEFDRFYSALTGDTLGNYFHFIVRFDNLCEPSRAMDFSPTILG